jgi:hypothetical protein
MPYVYIYLDPAKSGNFQYSDLKFCNEPFYVGKGSRNRDAFHLKQSQKSNYRLPFYDKLRSLHSCGKIPIIKRIADDLTHEAALILDKELIDKIGRRCLFSGPLLNLRNGGEGYGQICEETRKKLRDSHLGQRVWNKGQHGVIKHGPPSVEKRNKIRVAKQKTWIITDPFGNTKIILNLKRFCSENNLTYANMCAVGRGERTHHKYFTCKKENSLYL